jgi:hypothetical protein
VASLSVLQLVENADPVFIALNSSPCKRAALVTVPSFQVQWLKNSLAETERGEKKQGCLWLNPALSWSVILELEIAWKAYL